MSDSLRSNGSPAIVGRASLWGLICATGLVTAIAALYGVWLTIGAGVDKTGDFWFTAGYAPPMEHGTPALPDVPGVGAEVQLGYSDVVVSAPLARLREPQLFAAFATAIPFLIVVVGGIGIVVLARRLLAARPFSGAARVLLLLLGGLSVLGSVLAPWLEAHSVTRAVEILGLPADGTMVPSDQYGWIVSPGFDLLQDLHWPLLTLGVVLLLVGTLWRRASRLQRDTEGLV